MSRRLSGPSQGLRFGLTPSVDPIGGVENDAGGVEDGNFQLENARFQLENARFQLENAIRNPAEGAGGVEDGNFQLEDAAGNLAFGIGQVHHHAGSADHRAAQIR
jgi:hypothetical protein